MITVILIASAYKESFVNLFLRKLNLQRYRLITYFIEILLDFQILIGFIEILLDFQILIG